MTENYCPRSEIKKLETELWNLVVKGTNIESYTQCFQELILLCSRMVPDESDRVEKYTGGHPDRIQGSVVHLRQQRFKNPLSWQELSNKRQNVAMAYTEKSFEKTEYTGTLPLCNKCKFHHNGSCAAKCTNCKRVGRLARDCRCPTAVNTYRAPGTVQKTGTCFECGSQGHFKRDCLKVKNQNRGNQTRNDEARGRDYALGGGEPNPDSTVVMGTFLLDNHFVSVLFDTSADRSFVSTIFSYLIDITPSTLENSFDVELADRRIT
ncbi:reverse transcriptase domain-containing protein [Tanacetum coccineum]